MWTEMGKNSKNYPIKLQSDHNRNQSLVANQLTHYSYNAFQ